MVPQETSKNPVQSKWIGVGLFVMSLTLVILPLYFRQWFQEFAALGLVGIFVFNVIGSATVLIPSTAIVSVGVGGSLYNPLLVALFSAAGSALGEMVAYVLGYSSGKVVNVRQYKRIYKVFSIWFEKSGELTVFLLAFIPNPFFDVVGIFAGISRFSMGKFLVIVFVARFLRDVIIASTGAFFGARVY